MKRLTPKQTANLVSVFQHWGNCFHALSFLPSELLRDPTPAEIATHFEDQAKELVAIHSKLVTAVDTLDYKEAKRLASHANSIHEDISSEDREYGLVCLTDEAKGLAQKAIARAEKVEN